MTCDIRECRDEVSVRDRIESVLMAGGKDRLFAGAQIGNRRLA